MPTYIRKPSDPDTIIEPVELPEGHAILIAPHPDYVILPDQLGGGYCDVLSVAQLPWSPFPGTFTHYRLDKVIDGRRLWVAKVDKYYWYTRTDV